MVERTGPRIAFLHPHSGPITARDWSGTPLGLITALRARGVEVVEIGYDAPRILRIALHALVLASGARGAVAEHHPWKERARRRAMQRGLDRIDGLDAVLAVGTDAYRLDRLRIAVPVATYDDATLATMWAHQDSDTRGAGFDETDVGRWIATQRASSRAASVTCVSTAWAGRSFQRDYAIPEDRIAVVGMGHRPRAPRQESERDWTTPTYLFVGIDWRRKNGDALLRSFRRLREERPDAVLHLVGEHEPVEEPGVVDHGLLPRDDPAAQRTLEDLYATATAFVMPSRFDPSPIAYLEAASAGIPVVATTEGGAGELLGEAALTVHPDDEDALVAAMLQLADGSEARRRGEAASAASARSRWDDVVERILTALGSRRGTVSR